MFNLNKEIAKWKKVLRSNDTCSSADVMELESHLCDSMDNLKAKGLSEQEAFYIATHRLGRPDVLANEFGKVNEALRLWSRILYAGLGIILLNIISSISSILADGIRILLFGLGLKAKDIAYFGIAAQVIALLAVIISSYFLIKYKRNGIASFLGSGFGKASLVIITFILIVGSRVVAMLESIFLVRVIGASEYGQIALISHYFSFAYSIAIPMAIVISVVIIWHKQHAFYRSN